MPLKKWSSNKTISVNIKTLMDEKPSATRKKVIETIAKKDWISKRKAEQKQAIAIAYSEAGKSKYTKSKK